LRLICLDGFVLNPATWIAADEGLLDLAIAAKARTLAAVGLDPPRVALVDRSVVAGSWSGRQGYRSGLLPLGTPPEKDVGFPCADSWDAASSAVTAAMANFSWQRHLIAHGVYADWVDRGRLRPTHQRWSAYPREVAERAEAEIVAGEVVGLEVDGEKLESVPGEALPSRGTNSRSASKEDRGPRQVRI